MFRAWRKTVFSPLYYGSLLTGVTVVVSAAVILGAFFNNSSAQTATAPAPEQPVYGGTPEGVYKTLPVDAGLYNNGQAALWDLDIFDHYHYFGPVERAKGYAPEQPVKFSHMTHVQNNRMDCQYCHWTVTKSPFAAVPEVRACMGCHNLILGTSPEQQSEIAKVKQHFDKKEEISWVKVHVMPDHVHFNHKRHVKAGVSCQECHGQIPNMKTVERVSSMKMGWCLSCHRERGASIECLSCHH